MLQTSDGETEILLGNKQLLGIFFVVVILLGIAFAGGYKVGQGSKKAGSTASNVEQTASPASSAAETHSVAVEGAPASSTTPDSAAADSTSSPANSTAAQTQPAQSQGVQHQTSQSATRAKAPPSSTAGSGEEATPPLGSAKSAKALKPEPEDTEAPGPPTAAPNGHNGFTPQPGQIFLQVAAVGRDEAEGISDVLRKKGFRAHAVPKPGNTKLYRVIIGPTRDASDLSNTRTALRNTGFREIIVQKY